MLTDLHWIAPGKPLPAARGKRTVKKNMKSGADVPGIVARYSAFTLQTKPWSFGCGMPTFPRSSIIRSCWTKKTADFVCGEPPVIDAGDRTDALGRAGRHGVFQRCMRGLWMCPFLWRSRDEGVERPGFDHAAAALVPVLDAYDRKTSSLSGDRPLWRAGRSASRFTRAV